MINLEIHICQNKNIHLPVIYKMWILNCLVDQDISILQTYHQYNFVETPYIRVQTKLKLMHSICNCHTMVGSSSSTSRDHSCWVT